MGKVDMHTIGLKLVINNKNILILVITAILGLLTGYLYYVIDKENIELSIIVNSPEANNLGFTEIENKFINAYNKSISINDFISEYELSNKACRILSIKETGIFQKILYINLYSSLKNINECEKTLIINYQLFVNSKKNIAINSINNDSSFIKLNIKNDKDLGLTLSQLKFIMYKINENSQISLINSLPVISNNNSFYKTILSGAFVGFIIGLFLILKKNEI